MNTKISVIIPTYNRSNGFLQKAVQSVLDQTHQNLELIIVDDGSLLPVPGTGISPCRGRVIRQENMGPAGAKNTGIKAASGEFIAFLDSDDSWDKDKLKIQLSAMLKNPSYLISHTQEIWFQKGKILNQKLKHKKYNGYIFDKCLPICAVGMSTIMVRREFFDKVGLFDETFPCCEDYDLWLRASIKHEFLLVDHPLTLKDGGRPDQLSVIHRVGMDKYRIKSIMKILNRPGLTQEQCSLALKELKTKSRIYGNGCIKHGKIEEGNYYINLPKSIKIKKQEV